MKKTILFGNGPNYLSEHYITWETLLEKIKGENIFANGKLPNTMIYERGIIGNPISFDGLTRNEEAVKIEISKMMTDFPSNEFYKKMLDLDIDNYLTTNYDYAFIKDVEDFNIANKSTESIYSVRRHKEIYKKGKTKSKLWHIHGEINQPPSIMLGLDHYCGNVSKIDAYVKGRYEYTLNQEVIRVNSIIKKLKNKTFDEVSWVELFFISDIHIVGLSLDYSEIDIWWILNKRARLKLDLGDYIKNKIYFYSTSNDNDLNGLLKTFNVVVVEIPLDKTPDNYIKAYDNILKKIQVS